MLQTEVAMGPCYFRITHRQMKMKHIICKWVGADTFVRWTMSTKISFTLTGSQSGKYLRTGFPLGLENLEKWEGIFQSGKSQGILMRLEKSGKSQGKSHKILEN